MQLLHQRLYLWSPSEDIGLDLDGLDDGLGDGLGDETQAIPHERIAPAMRESYFAMIISLI